VYCAYCAVFIRIGCDVYTMQYVCQLENRVEYVYKCKYKYIASEAQKGAFKRFEVLRVIMVCRYLFCVLE